MNALELIDDLIAELEGRLNLKPGEAPQGTVASEVGEAGPESTLSSGGGDALTATASKKKADKKQKPPASKGNNKSAENSKVAESDDDQPEICKLEFKVGVIRKVWVHPTADKLYCEEIDVNEPDGPRLIASGLRAHFTLEEMLDRKVLVVANLKAKNLVGFKSHGMVLCAASAAQDEDGTERVEFVEPPDNAIVGEVVTFEGLPPPRPVTAAQVEKKKVFQNCMPGMRTTKDCVAAWEGHAFVTSAGPCRVKSIADACLR